MKTPKKVKVGGYDYQDINCHFMLQFRYFLFLFHYFLFLFHHYLLK